MAKMIAFDEDARPWARTRFEHPRRHRQGDVGPRGRNVVLAKKWGAPTITNDGVSIAKEIESRILGRRSRGAGQGSRQEDR